MGLTVRDLAKICGVNASTVSRALRDDPRITPATREKVQLAARDAGYSPNLTARNLAAGKTNSVWFFLGSLENEIEWTPATYLSQILRDAGYDLLVVIHNGDLETLRRLLWKLSQNVADAAIIIPPGYEVRGLLEDVAKPSLPVIFLDRWIPGAENPVITTANADAARHLTALCRQAGAEFFIVLFAAHDPVSMVRQDAACEWLDSMGLPYCTQADFSDETMQSHFNRPFAVLGSSGKGLSVMMQQRFGETLKTQNVIGGFFDYWENQNKDFFSRIFICRQDYRELAKRCAKVILNWLKSGKPPQKKMILVPPESFTEI